MDEIKRARETRDAQNAALLEMIGEYDRCEEWRADGYGSAAAAISDACRVDKGVAVAEVKLARKLEKLPLVAAAFGAGQISQRHAEAIATSATAERLAEFTNLEAEFVDCALQCAPKELARIVRYVTDALDGDGGAGAEDKLYERRRYQQSRTMDNTLAVNGFLDPESADVHEAAWGCQMVCVSGRVVARLENTGDHGQERSRT